MAQQVVPEPMKRRLDAMDQKILALKQRQFEESMKTVTVRWLAQPQFYTLREGTGEVEIDGLTMSETYR